jgi:hypothetical protein
MDRSKLPALTPAQSAEFRTCLADGNPIESLRRLALRLSGEGMRQREIYLLFLAYHVDLESKGETDRAAILGDVMDMIVDAYPPFNLGLPK